MAVIITVAEEPLGAAKLAICEGLDVCAWGEASCASQSLIIQWYTYHIHESIYLEHWIS
jgi:hypothetical protein